LHQVAQSNIGVVPLFRLLVACTMVQLPPWSPAPTRWSSEAVQFRLWHFSVWGAAKGPAIPTTEKEYIAYLQRGSTRRTTPRPADGSGKRTRASGTNSMFRRRLARIMSALSPWCIACFAES